MRALERSERLGAGERVRCAPLPCSATQSHAKHRHPAKVTGGVKCHLKNIYLQASVACNKLLFKFVANSHTRVPFTKYILQQPILHTERTVQMKIGIGPPPTASLGFIQQLSLKLLQPFRFLQSRYKVFIFWKYFLFIILRSCATVNNSTGTRQSTVKSCRCEPISFTLQKEMYKT